MSTLRCASGLKAQAEADVAPASGDAWIDKGATCLIFGPPGVDKSHVACGIGRALIDAGHRVLYMRTSELVQRLQAARQNLQLPQALAKLDRYDLLVLDDLSYVRKDQAETSVLFELIAEGYERRSILITANQPFSGGFQTRFLRDIELLLPAQMGFFRGRLPPRLLAQRQHSSGIGVKRKKLLLKARHYTGSKAFFNSILKKNLKTFHLNPCFFSIKETSARRGRGGVTRYAD